MRFIMKKLLDFLFKLSFFLISEIQLLISY